MPEGMIRAVSDWLAGGSVLAALRSIALAVGALVCGLIYRRYLGILGADPNERADRQDYDALRNSLAQGNSAAQLYVQRLTRSIIRTPTWRQSLPVARGETRDCSQNGGRHHYVSIKQTAEARWFRRMICS